MPAEVGDLRLSTLMLWKTDRLARDQAIAAIAKKTVREARCAIEYVAETTLEDTPEGKLIESFFDSLAEFYSSQLSVNTSRGMRYNAENAKFNGHRVLEYRMSEDGRYEIDPISAPVVQRIFTQYADGKAMTDIIEELTAQGIRSVKGNRLTVNSLRHILHNDRYLGIYRYADVVIPGGMPQLVDLETFDRVQARFEYALDLPPQGFACFADGGTMMIRPPLVGGLRVSELCAARRGSVRCHMEATLCRLLAAIEFDLAENLGYALANPIAVSVLRSLKSVAGHTPYSAIVGFALGTVAAVVLASMAQAQLRPIAYRYGSPS